MDEHLTGRERRIRTLDILMRHFPKAFMQTGKQPLKKGIHLDVLQRITEATDDELKSLSKRDVRLSFHYYNNSIAYLKTHQVGTPRVDLEGCPAGEVTAEEAQYAKHNMQARMQRYREHKNSKNKSIDTDQENSLIKTPTQV